MLKRSRQMLLKSENDNLTVNMFIKQLSMRSESYAQERSIIEYQPCQSKTLYNNNKIPIDMSSSYLLGIGERRQSSTLNRSSFNNLKYKTAKILRPTNLSSLNVIDNRQISQQLNEELNRINELLCTCKRTLENHSFLSKKNQPLAEQVLSIEESIITKDQQIKKISSEIKKLKEVKDSVKDKQIHTQTEIFSLAQELKGQRVQLKELIEDHSQKVQSQRLLLMAITKLEKIYNEKYPNRSINYELFKEKQEQNKKEQGTIKKVKVVRGPSIRERCQTSNQYSTNPNNKTETTEGKSMKELQEKKKIAQLAIKNAKKKYQGQLNELTAKLEFLRDENVLLNEQIREKESEKRSLEAKFKLNVQNRMKLRKELEFVG